MTDKIIEELWARRGLAEGPLCVEAKARIEQLQALNGMMVEALGEARPIIEEERQVCLDGYTVLYKGDPGFGTVTDLGALEMLAKYESALAKIDAILAQVGGEG